jgi:FkbM family methyltransferase
MIGRTARGLLRRTPLGALARRAAQRLQRDGLLSEDILPYDVHRFDPHTWVLKETEFGVRLWCSLDERAISRPILLNSYEPAETQFIARTLRSGELAVDAGANIGYHALHLARLVGRDGLTIAFEPLPYLADALLASVAENDFATRVDVHRSALDERAGTLRLRHAPRTANFGGAHLAPDTAPPEAHADESVPAVTLDEIVAGRRCSFLKMDVEGAEPRVVRGAHATLATGRPVILCELHDRQLHVVSSCSAADFIAQMAALGYRCSRLNADGTRGNALERYAGQVPINVVFDPLAATSSL